MIPKIFNYNFNMFKIPFKQGGAINNSVTNPKFEKSPSEDSFEISIGYVNDTHGQTNNMMRILSGLKGDLNLSGGDNDIGDEKNKPVHNVTMKFLNMAGIKASALGNHEIDASQEDCIDTFKGFNGDILALNFDQDSIENEDPEDIKKYGRAQLSDVLKKSKIVEVKGEKIGLLGACPMDMFERLTHPNYYTDCSVEDLDDTIELIQEEIEKLKSQGVNKIVLLSHMGPKRDRTVAQNVDGLDVIISGHTHELLQGIKEGENLVYSKTGEPVIITEAGRDGNYFGKLNLVFDKDGVITKAQNNLGETGLFYKNLINQYVFDSILGEPETVGYIKHAPQPPKSLIEENPHANFVCDIMKEKTNSDIGLWHNCGVRNFFHVGSIDTRDVKDITPFLDYVAVANVSEKALVELFKNAVETTYKTPAHKPGLIAVSGLEYTVDPEKGELVSMHFIDKNGKVQPLNIDNPSEDKKFKVVTDEFLMSAGADFKVLAPEEEYLQKFPHDKDVMICEYIKEMDEPVVIEHSGRIKFESKGD